MHRLSIILITLLSASQAQEYTLEPINVEATQDVFTQTQEEALKKNAFTLQERLKNDVSFDTVTGEKNGEDLSYRGIDTRATGYYEDGIPLYRTVNGFVASTFYSPTSTLVISSTSPSPSGVSSMGADINIVTSVPTQSLESTLLGSLSTNDYRLSGYLGTRIASGYIQLNASQYDMNSYSLSDNYTPTPAQPKGDRINSDKHQEDVSLKTGMFIGSHGHIAAKFSNSRSEFGVPHNATLDITALPWTVPLDSYARVNQKDLNSFYLYGDYIGNDIEMDVRLYHDKYKDIYDWYETSTYNSFLFPSSTYDDSRTGGIIKTTLKSSKHSDSLLLQSERNTHKMIVNGATTKFFESDTLNLSYIADYALSSTLRAEGALSYRQLHPKNDYEEKQLFDYQLKLTQKYGDDSLYLAASHKSRFPSMEEMFDFFGIVNPNLKPEQSRNLEAGYQSYVLPRSLLSLEGYYYDLQDLIIKPNNTYYNRESAEHYGIETRLKTDILNSNHIGIGYRYAHTRDSAGDKIELIPQNRFTLEDTFDLVPNLNLTIAYLYTGKRTSSYQDVIHTLNDYQTIDMYLGYVQKKGISYRFGVKNLTDEAYEWRYGYPAQGISAFAALQWDL